MSAPNSKVMQVRPQWDEAKLIEVAEKMKIDGREGLQIEKVKLGVKDLSFLEHFDHLKFLFISGVKAGITAIKHLTELEELGLMHLKQFKCAPLRDVPQLKELGMGFMSISSWEGIEGLVELQELALYDLTGLPDIEFVTRMPLLEVLSIKDCKELARLPDLSGMRNLTHVWLGRLPNLECIAGVFNAPALKHLVVSVTPKLQPEALQPALSHPTLEKIDPWLVGIADAPKDARVAEILRPRFGDVLNQPGGVWREPRRTY